MKPITKIVHVPPSTNGHLAITCPQCDKRKRVKVSALPKSSKPIKTRCACGCIFRLVLDAQDCTAATSTNLTGAYMKVAKFGSNEFGFFDVRNLSTTGLIFIPRSYHNIKAGEILKINFVLNDAEASEIDKFVQIKNVYEKGIHAEFCDKKTLDTALIRYLKAS